MRVVINNQILDVPEQATLDEVLKIFGARPPFAVAVNLGFVHRQHYGQTRLQPDDRIEVVQPVAGG